MRVFLWIGARRAQRRRKGLDTIDLSERRALSDLSEEENSTGINSDAADLNGLISVIRVLFFMVGGLSAKSIHENFFVRLVQYFVKFRAERRDALW